MEISRSNGLLNFPAASAISFIVEKQLAAAGLLKAGTIYLCLLIKGFRNGLQTVEQNQDHELLWQK